MGQKRYDSTVARMAGNIAAGLVSKGHFSADYASRRSVEIARAIVAEVERTEKEASNDPQTVDPPSSLVRDRDGIGQA